MGLWTDTCCFVIFWSYIYNCGLYCSGAGIYVTPLEHTTVWPVSGVHWRISEMRTGKQILTGMLKRFQHKNWRDLSYGNNNLRYCHLHLYFNSIISHVPLSCLICSGSSKHSKIFENSKRLSNHKMTDAFNWSAVRVTFIQRISCRHFYFLNLYLQGE